MALIVFTDLDGSLMEHETYSIDPARQALDALAARDIPLVLNSSKTTEEMLSIQALLDLHCPFISENGATLQRSNEAILEFGERREHWLERIHQLRTQHSYSFQGFSDWSPAEISSITGLDAEQARQAKTRLYSEPILWRDSESALQSFQHQLSEMGLRILQGGRFKSIQGAYDKSDAMRTMIASARENNHARELITVALGDSPNDAAMLNTADIAVVIKSAKSSLIHCPEAKRIIYTEPRNYFADRGQQVEIIKLYDSDQLKNFLNQITPTNSQS